MMRPIDESVSGSAQPRVAVITCAVLEDEIEHFVRDRRHVVHVEMLEQGLHNEPDRLHERLQVAIDRVERKAPEAQVIVLGYGLCSRGTEGVRASRCRLVMARAHDCITLLLGDRQQYAEYVARHPGTYWYSPGWNRHHLPPGQARYERLYEQYRKAYGEDNAQYLMETEQHWFATYDRATYVDLGVGATPEDIAFTQECADWLGWSFDRMAGSPALLEALLDGPWDDERFITLEPGEAFEASGDQAIVRLSVRGRALAH